MTAREWKPGDVAIATVRGVPNVRVMAGYGTAEPRLRWVTTDDRLVDAENEGWWFSFQVTDARPLVVIDPEDREAVERLAKRIGHLWKSHDYVADVVQAALREFANPKPEEPTGLGAVVKDSSGLEWVRVHPGGKAWVNGYQRWASWDELLDIGVTEVVRP